MSTDENRTLSTSFPRLNETNYTEWSIRMEAQLIRLGLWNQVVCDVESTTTEDDAKAKDKWLKKRKAAKMAEARAEIILRVYGVREPQAFVVAKNILIGPVAKCEASLRLTTHQIKHVTMLTCA